MSLSEDALVRIQTALERRVATYSMKQRLLDPLADDDCNRHERYAFAVECFEIFAREAGLEIPPHIYADEAVRKGAASGIETEGRNNEDWSGAQHESPTGVAGDAQEQGHD